MTTRLHAAGPRTARAGNAHAGHRRAFHAAHMILAVLGVAAFAVVFGVVMEALNDAVASTVVVLAILLLFAPVVVTRKKRHRR